MILHDITWYNHIYIILYIYNIFWTLVVHPLHSATFRLKLLKLHPQLGSWLELGPWLSGLPLMCSIHAPTCGWRRPSWNQRRRPSSLGAKPWWRADGGNWCWAIWSWTRPWRASWSGLGLPGLCWCPFWRSSCPTSEWTRPSWWLVPPPTAEPLSHLQAIAQKRGDYLPSSAESDTFSMNLHEHIPMTYDSWYNTFSTTCVCVCCCWWVCVCVVTIAVAAVVVVVRGGACGFSPVFCFDR